MLQSKPVALESYSHSVGALRVKPVLAVAGRDCEKKEARRDKEKGRKEKGEKRKEKEGR